MPVPRSRRDLFDRFHFFRGEEEAVSRLPHHAKLAARIVIQHHCKMNLIVEVLLDGFDDCHFAGQCHVDYVGGLLRPEANAIADTQSRCQKRVRSRAPVSFPPADSIPRSMHRSWAILANFPHSTNYAVCLHQRLRSERLCPFQYIPRTRIAVTHLLFFCIRQESARAR